MKSPVVRIVLVLLLVVVLAAGGWLFWIRGSGLPWRSGDHPVAGLGADVLVAYDALGVPHIEGETTNDALAALGWVHANDRFTQMELGRRAAFGRLSEVLGDATLDADRHFRTLRFGDTAERLAEHASDDSKDRLEAYARGVNAWLAERAGDLPPVLRALGVEPEPWRPADSLGFVLMMANDLSFWKGRPEETRFQWLRAFGPDRVRDLLDEPGLEIDPEILALAEALGPPRPTGDAPGSGTAGEAPSPGSNNWAVGPSRTASGHGLLANDPHLALTLPSVWYQVLVRSPGYTAAGMSLPGVPGVVLGRGEQIAWAFTNTMLDDHDLFVEDVDLEAGTYRRGNDWLPLEIHDVEIAVRGGDPVPLRLYDTDLGPLLPADEESGLPARSLVWTLYHPGDPVAALAAVAHASDWETLLAGIEPYVGPAQNLVVSFATGELIYTVIGAIPHRQGEPASSTDGSTGEQIEVSQGSGTMGRQELGRQEPGTGVEGPGRQEPGTGRGRMLVPAWTGEAGWQGLRPRSTHPTVIAPADDRLVTANHDIRPVGYSLPLAAEFFPGHRARRIAERLDARDDWDPAGFADLQVDVVSTYAEDLLAALAADWKGFGGSGGLARDTLAEWDRAMEMRGPAALFALVERNLLAVFFGDEAGAHGLEPLADRRHLLRLLEGRLDPVWFDDVSTLETETRSEQVERALADAWNEGAARWGEDPTTWNYGEIHVLILAHPLDTLPLFGPWARRGPIEVPGSNTTVAAFGALWRGERQEVVFGPSMRWVVDWSQPETALAALPGGQSGHPGDPHYDDRLAPYLAGELSPAPWSPEEVAAATVSTVRLVP